MARPEECSIAFRRCTVCRLVLNKTEEFSKIYFFDLRLFSSLHTTRFTTTWPVRLSVRTPGFQPGKRGSIPLRATTRLNYVIREEYHFDSSRFFSLFKKLLFQICILKKHEFIQLGMCCTHSGNTNLSAVKKKSLTICLSIK